MIKEFITINQKETSVKIENSAISAVRNKDITKKGVRVYDNGKIGITGMIGNGDDETLVKDATLNLSVGIDYPYEVSKDHKEHRNLTNQVYSPSELIQEVEKLLAYLRENYSHLDFSHMISINELTKSMRNDAGLDLVFRDFIMSLGLVIKENDSVELFDGFMVYNGRNFDADKFIESYKPLLEAYNNKVEIPEGEKLPVFSIDGSGLVRYLLEHTSGEKYGTKSSVFDGKLGEKIFESDFTMKQSMDSEKTYSPFFDAEGVTLDAELPLFEKGVFKNVYTDKKTAATYGYPLTGAASGEYDGRPMIGSPSIWIDTDASDIKKALKGQMAILAVISAGGDFTYDGDYAAPVQVSFLFDGEKIIGKLPELAVSSTIYDMLGKDYIGTFETDAIYMGDQNRLTGCYMTINRG